MEQLYTPWRKNYVTSNNKMEGCVFCACFKEVEEHDRKNYLIYRGKNTFVIMNIYPYNTGHLMILPHEHISTLAEMSEMAQNEMIRLATYFTDLLSGLMKPDGFNLGIDIRRTAGAGIDSDLHMRLVRRWSGDGSFMAVIGQARVLPETLGETYERILATLKRD